jgi:hypothetical protein
MAMITNYASLKTGIAGWLDINSTDLSSQIDDLIMVGEKRIFREVRTRDMEVALNATIANGVIALPTGYVALKNARINTSPVVELERRSAEWIYKNYGFRTSSGIPKYIARDGTNLIFGPYPDSGYNVIGTYYARLDSIANSVTALFSSNPDIYLMAALAEAEPLLGRDPRIPMWQQKYTEILTQMNGEDKVEDQSGSSLQMRVGTDTSWNGKRYW